MERFRGTHLGSPIWTKSVPIKLGGRFQFLRSVRMQRGARFQFLGFHDDADDEDDDDDDGNFHKEGGGRILKIF